VNIRVINYASGLRPNPGEVEIYVGRSRWVGISPLGNPFSRVKYGRDECIKMFREWLAERLSDPTSDQAIELESIRQVAKDHPIALRCHCAPLPCHADVIKELLEAA
jgi:hypothetical protein